MKSTPDINAVVATLRKGRDQARRFARRTQVDEDYNRAKGMADAYQVAIELLTKKPKS